jgi:Serine acetyltransferase
MFQNIKDDIRRVPGHWLRVLLTNRGVHALICYRISHFLWKHKIPLIPLILTRIIQILYGIDIDWRSKISGGCLIVHGVGLVIGNGVVIGKNAKIYHGVTLGIKDNGRQDDGFPIVGQNVLIGSGAKILGNVKIGDNVKIGANSVVLHDVPDNCTVMGIPANVIKK